MDSIYQELLAAGIELDHHQSDLYAKATDVSREIVQRYQFASIVTTFRSNIDGSQWFDIPFAYEPYWEQKAGGSSNA